MSEAVNITTVITSAAVGAIAAEAINLLNQALERRSRLKELALSKAIELAIDRARFVCEVAKDQNQEADISDPGVNFAVYFRWLMHIVKKGDLPSDAKKLVNSQTK